MVVAMAMLEFGLILLACISFILAYFFGSNLWVCYLNSLIIFMMISIIVWSIPLNLSWSKGLYGHLLKKIVIFTLFSILIYALEYWKIGIRESGGGVVYSLYDSVYFSVTTWTTLGYGDFSPIPSSRLLTSLEALTGLISIPLTASMIWLYCQERMHEDTSETHNLKSFNISFDETIGMWKEVESKKTIEEQKERDSKFNLNICKLCQNDKLSITKYLSIHGVIVPLRKYIVHCSCGNQSKVYSTAYQAYSNWNKKNG